MDIFPFTILSNSLLIWLFLRTCRYFYFLLFLLSNRFLSCFFFFFYFKFLLNIWICVTHICNSFLICQSLCHIAFVYVHLLPILVCNCVGVSRIVVLISPTLKLIFFIRYNLNMYLSSAPAIFFHLICLDGTSTSILLFSRALNRFRFWKCLCFEASCIFLSTSWVGRSSENRIKICKLHRSPH